VRRVNEAAQGKVYGPVAFELAEERVRAFAELFGPLEGVPPTFLSAAEFALFPAMFGDPDVRLDFGRVVHSSQEYEFRRPLLVGEVLTVESRIATIRHKGGNGFLTVEMSMRGSDGEIAATTRSTLIERGVNG
jgi:acyl dehydratase